LQPHEKAKLVKWQHNQTTSTNLDANFYKFST
jgi:hypothetical protein